MSASLPDLSLDELGRGLSPGSREILERLYGRLLSDEKLDSTAERLAGELPRDFDPASVWEAVGALHEGLDDPEIAASDRKRLRSRLNTLSLELSRAILFREGGAYRRLLRDVSHDIRSPLQSIILLTESLYTEQETRLSAAEHRKLGIVYAAGVSLLNQVNDFLDLSRAAEGETPEVEEIVFSVASVAADVRRLVGPLAHHHGTEVNVDLKTEGPRRGDPQVLCRLLLNLVSNAIRATEDAGEVDVVFEDADDGMLHVDVIDDGSGADLDAMRDLVGSLQKGAATGSVARMLEGRTQGVGLVICGGFVRAAGGRIEVDRADDRGTRFSMDLPFAQA